MSWRLPLYSAASQADLSLGSGNVGLRYTKYADAWTPDAEKYLVFDPRNEDRRDENDDRCWIDHFVQTPVGDSAQLEEAVDRLEKLIGCLGGKVIRLRNTGSRFVTGMGLQHPSGNGFAWHHTLGVPYLSGSSLKGAVLAYASEYCMSDEERTKFDKANGDEDFGKRDSVGQYIFTDLLPMERVQLATEIMTPHYGPYYQNGATPGDWHSPVPINFLTVESDQPWMCGILPTTPQAGLTTRSLENMAELLLGALCTTGVGAKTNVGFGYFDPI